MDTDGIRGTPNEAMRQASGVDATHFAKQIDEAKKVLQLELTQRREFARREVDTVLKKYGFVLAARVIIEGGEINTHIGLEQDPSWKPSSPPMSEPHSGQ